MGLNQPFDQQIILIDLCLGRTKRSGKWLLRKTHKLRQNSHISIYSNLDSFLKSSPSNFLYRPLIMLRVTHKLLTRRNIPLKVKFSFLSQDSVKNLGSVDDNYLNDRIDKKHGDQNTREFTYFLLGANQMAMASMARLALIKVMLFLSTSYFI